MSENQRDMPNEAPGPEAPSQDRVWEEGWEGHELAQLRRMAKLSFADKLRWLESAQQLSLQLQRQRDGLGPLE